jgi:probable F420-dependent oxidoreductase
MSLGSFAAEDPGSWDRIVTQARVLDRAGVDRLAVSDHIAFGEHLEEYARPEIGGRRGGRQPTGPDGHWLEPLTTLAFVGGVTERIRLSTGILIAALRRPSVLAKATATLDVLSGGRLDIGVGVGWQREEYEVSGLQFDGRGKLLDEALEICRTLWTSTRASYASESLTFENIHMMPKPAQPGGVPIWVSGTVNPRVVRRVAEYGSGWIPWGDDADDTVAGIRSMRQALAEIGKDGSDLQVVGGLRAHRNDDGTVDPARTFVPVPEMLAGGVTDFRLTPVSLPADEEQALDYVSGIVEAFRTARDS